MHLDERFIKEALPEVLVYGSNFPEELTFSIDTRSLQKGDIFIALPGKNTDGHKFVEEAVDKGASGFIVSNKNIIDNIKNKKKELFFFVVPDTFKALYMLAAAWRKKFSGHVVAITGSVGKTSTKESSR